MSEINGIPVVDQVFVEDKEYSVPFITSIDGDLFLLQTIRNRSDDGYEPYYVRIGSVLKKYLEVRNRKEPTQEEIENNVSPYQRGYVDGYRRGRENGVNEGRTLVEEDEYKRGLKDAWNCARKIVMQESDGSMSCEDLEEVFGTGYFATIFKENEACNAISKIEKFESKNKSSDGTFVYDEPKASQDTVNLKLRDIDGNLHEVEVPVKEKTCQLNESDPLTFKDIEIGDEIESIVDSPIYVPTVIIVTYNCSDRIYGFRKNTGTYMQIGASNLPNWRKTGVTHPEIAKIIGGKNKHV